MKTQKTDMKINYRLRHSLLAAASSLLAVSHSHAADGTWNIDTTNGLWSLNTNWSSSVIADGSGFTANFTNNITGDRTVRLDGDRTLTSLVFSDSDTSSAGSWTLDNNGDSSNNLILDGTGAGIAVYALGAGKTATISAIIQGTAGLVKSGTGTLILSGSNTYTGTTTIKGSQLVLDYSGPADPLSTGAVTLDMGTLTLKGKTSGATTETISTLYMGANLGTANTLKLDSNGGSGIVLTVSNFRMNTTASIPQNINLIDLSSSASNSIAVTLGTTAKVFNDVLMHDNGSAGRANLVVRDSTGYGFATLSGASSGTIGRLSTGTTLTGSNSSNTVNYRLTTSGTLTRTAELNYSTITLDSAAGAVTLDMGANNLAPNGNGRGILITGPNDVSITGSGRLEGGGSTWFHNYSTGTFTYGLGTASSAAAFLMFGGSGLTVWTGTLAAATKVNADNLYIEGGIFRPTTAQDWSSAGSLAIKLGGVFVSSGGVLEVGADLNGATAGDLSNTIGTSAGNIRFWGSSGVSASGANRTVNFGGGTSLTWGSSSFLTDAGGSGDGNYAFKLSSDRSGSTVTVQNAIALGSLNRTVEVANGSAATDAILSGVLSGAGGLTKTGIGTLALTAANTYTGPTTVSAGTLEVSGAIGTGAVTVTAGTLGGTGTINGTVTIGNSTGSADAILAPGASIDSLDTGSLSFLSDGSYAVELNGSSVTTDVTNVTGTVAIDAATTLTVDVAGTLSGSQQYVIVSNDAADAITGTFAGLAQGATVGTFGGTPLKISYIGGDGNDIVLYTEGSGSPYSTWAGSAAFTDDANGDGVDNGLAWFLGASAPAVSALDKLPLVATPTGFLTLDFDRVNPSSPAKLYVEYGNDLVGWTRVLIPVLATGTHTIGGDLEVVVTAGTPDQLLLKIPTTHAVGGKLFARLVAQP